MKDYKKVAEDVFRRRDEIIAENKLRRKRLVEICASAACWVAVAAIGFGIWKTNISGKNIGTVDPQSGTSQGANVSRVNSEPLSGNTSDTNNTFNKFLDDNGVDIRCYPRHSNVFIGYHTRIDNYDIQSEGIIDRPTGVMYGSQINAGDVLYSNELKQAMAKYGETDEYGEIYYDVIIQYYKFNSGIEPDMELFESEREKFGINFFIETDIDGHCYLGTHNATYDMLKNLAPNDEYGYYIRLRGEIYINSNKCVYNHGDHTASFELEGADFCKLRGQITNIDADIKEPEHSPENGTAVISESLKKAVEMYGKEDKNGELYYDVVVEYYKDGKRINTTWEIHDFEEARGSKLAIESHSNDFGATWEHRMHKMMTVDEIESFEPSAEYGYVLHLKNFYLGLPYDLMSNVINGLYNNGVYIE